MLDLLQLSWNGAVFIAAIVLLRLLLCRYLPRTAFVVLWLTAAVRLLCPVRLPSPTSVWALFARRTAARAAGGLVPVRRYPAVAALPVRDALPDVCDFPGKVWLAGMALLLLGIAVLYCGGMWEARRATRLDCGAYVCKGLASPRLCGIVRPRILLPEGVGEDLLPYILLHERVHLRRLDNLWKLLALVAAAVHWFNPAAWVLVVLLGRDLEVSCDEWVLHGLDDGQRRSYALSLIAMAEGPHGRSPVACGFSRNPLEERIRYIMTNRKKSMLALSAATAMIVCTTAALATDAPAADSADVRTAVYSVKARDGAGYEGLVTITKAEEAELVTGFAGDLEFFTAEEYEDYIARQKIVLLDGVEKGALSREAYDMTIRDMEQMLAGIRDGSVMMSRAVEGEDGSITEYTISTLNTANAEDIDGYDVEADGTLSVVLNDFDYTLMPISER